jgi:hypothetical protein
MTTIFFLEIVHSNENDAYHIKNRIIQIYFIFSTFDECTKNLKYPNGFQGIIMDKKTLLVMTAAILVAVVVTGAICNSDVANAQGTNMTAGGGNMTKTMNMTAGGGNMTKTMNMTAGGGNMTKTMNSTH